MRRGMRKTVPRRNYDNHPNEKTMIYRKKIKSN